MLEVLRYIHRNSLQARITDNLKGYEWSRHHGYISKAKKWEWLYKDVLLSLLSTNQSRQRSTYNDFVSRSISEEIERFYFLKNIASVLGAEAFKEWVRDKFDQLRFHPEIPDSCELTPAPESILDCVSGYFKITKEQLLTSRRGTENLPRDIAIYLVRLWCRETLAEIGSYFGIKNYSTVSSAIERIKARKKTDRLLQKHLKVIAEKLDKSQQHT